MKIKGLDGQIYSFRPNLNSHPSFSSSKLHQRAKKILEEMFPLDNIYEEVSLPGSKTRINSTLIADFFLPKKFLMVEVHGQQHYKFNSFHYKSKADFFYSKNRDINKKKWCELNQITLIELPYDESEDQWRERISNSRGVG